MPTNPKEVTILLVDDEVDLREAVAFDFQMKGYNVVEAGNGREAFEALCKAPKVDLIVSDVRMPGGDGIELLEKTKERDPKQPAVVLVTGFADISTEDAFDKGASAVLSKPFDRKVLMATIIKTTSPLTEAWSGQLPSTAPQSAQTLTPFKVDLELESAVPSGSGPRNFSLGRGGIFVALPGPFPQGDGPVEFRIRFKGGPLALIEGTGVARWNRTKPSADLALGSGIEILTLVDSCRQAVADHVTASAAKAFIPKG
jgi:CheY-like chemotaxis protein